MKTMPNGKTPRWLLPVLAAGVVALAVWGPQALARYGDRAILNRIEVQPVENAGEGYRYTLGNAERLHILSACLSSWEMAESEQSAWTREETQGDYEGTPIAGDYAFIVNRQGPSENQITAQELYELCNRELRTLEERGILPADTRPVEEDAYEAQLYSAIDVLEPRSNVAVWKLNLAGGARNEDKSDRLMDAYLDADTGRIYEFYVRTSLDWAQIDTDRIVQEWSDYMGLEPPKDYQPANPLLETTPYYRKYVFTGESGERTIVTVGYYEGIRELFLKVSK